jgi:hypothetical protein
MENIILTKDDIKVVSKIINIDSGLSEVTRTRLIKNIYLLNELVKDIKRLTNKYTPGK